MKTVDENYSYDEFEGFTPLDLSMRVSARGRMHIHVSRDLAEYR